ncbi:MAG: peptidase S41 [Bacteroidetes bacterium]|nr:peptidase S41 [Bacteroidota bacterium]
MKFLPLFFILFFFTNVASGQEKVRQGPLNKGFEQFSADADLPDEWIKWGTEDFFTTVDSANTYSGKYAVRIESQQKFDEGSLGCVAQSIPAIYQGKTLTVIAWLKLENIAGGYVGVIVRINGNDGVLAIDNMLNKKVQGTQDWAEYSVDIDLPGDATTIWFGAISTGTGILWVDDFRLLIDGKDISKARKKIERLLKADQDKEFDAGSKIFPVTLTPSKLDGMWQLGKTWGFLKYYHPAIARGEYNWDYELFRIMPAILASNDRGERNRIFLDWVRNLGPVKGEKPKTFSDNAIKMLPNLGWLTDTVALGGELSALLSEIRNSKRPGQHYYIRFSPGAGNPEFMHERAYQKMRSPDVGFRLLALYRYWNIIEYYFPYKYMIGENWDELLREYIPVFMESSGEMDYKIALLGIITRVNDTHAGIWSYDNAMQNFLGRNYAPVQIGFVGDTAVITDLIRDKMPKDLDIKIGDILLKIDDLEISEKIKARFPFSPASNLPTKLRNIAENLGRTNDTIIQFTLLRGDTKHIVSITCFPADPFPPNIRTQRKDTCFRQITPEIAYIYPGSLRDEDLPVILPEIMKSKGLIIDLRCYPKSFITHTFGRYLVSKATPFAKATRPDPETPGLFKEGSTITVGKRNKKAYKGKVIILVNEYSQSNSEFTAMAFRAAPGAIVIGSTTAGADGNVSAIMLPGNVATGISGIGIYYPDGTETQRVGIIPTSALFKPLPESAAEKTRCWRGRFRS